MPLSRNTTRTSFLGERNLKLSFNYYTYVKDIFKLSTPTTLTLNDGYVNEKCHYICATMQVIRVDCVLCSVYSVYYTLYGNIFTAASGLCEEFFYSLTVLTYGFESRETKFCWKPSIWLFDYWRKVIRTERGSTKCGLWAPQNSKALRRLLQLPPG